MGRRGIVILAAITVFQPAFAQDTNIPLSTPGLHNACKVFPGKPLSEATTAKGPADIRCEWLSDVKVEGGSIKGGSAGVNTTDVREVYDVMKAVQNEYASAYLNQPELTLYDESNIIDCQESRMIIWKDKGVPSLSQFTAWCGGVAIHFATSGADYTEDGTAKFAQVVRSIIGEKLKK
jgi:hypothetical protein